MLWWNIIAISILAALAVASDSKSATDDAQNNIMHHTRELFGLNQVRKFSHLFPPPFNILYYCGIDRTFMLTNIATHSPTTTHTHRGI